MKLCISISALTLALVPGVVSALTLAFPAPGVLTSETVIDAGEADLPVAPFADGALETRAVAGQVRRMAWRLPSQGLTTFQILAPLREQLEAAGYEIRFECDDRACGGFDFRFATELVPEPAMFVDLGDFRYLMAQKGEHDAVALMVSRAPNAGFVQMTRVMPRDSAVARVVSSSKSVEAPRPVGESDLNASLRQTGAAPLDDLLFDTGSASLSDGAFTSLEALSDFMRANPDVAVTLVGHTDDEGALAGNIALSKRRAQSVQERLIRDYGVAGARLRAEGVGYLAPRASNASDAGRLANRRVEAILTP